MRGGSRTRNAATGEGNRICRREDASAGHAPVAKCATGARAVLRLRDPYCKERDLADYCDRLLENISLVWLTCECTHQHIGKCLDGSSHIGRQSGSCFNPLLRFAAMARPTRDVLHLLKDAVTCGQVFWECATCSGQRGFDLRIISTRPPASTNP